MIRAFKETDIEQVMQIWLQGNIEAHPFVSEAYWKSNFDEVQEQIVQAEVFVYEMDGKIVGFIGLVEGYIAGIFVEQSHRSFGIGKQLLDDAKQRHESLCLGVYQKNKRAVEFYLREGFMISEKGMDEETGEVEYTMCFAHRMH